MIRILFLFLLIQLPLLGETLLSFSDPARQELALIEIPSEEMWARQVDDQLDPEFSSVLFFAEVDPVEEYIECIYQLSANQTLPAPTKEEICHEIPGGWLTLYPTEDRRALIEYWDGVTYYLKAIIAGKQGRFLVTLFAPSPPSSEKRQDWCSSFQKIALFEGGPALPSTSEGWGFGLLSTF